MDGTWEAAHSRLAEVDRALEANERAMVATLSSLAGSTAVSPASGRLAADDPMNNTEAALYGGAERDRREDPSGPGVHSAAAAYRHESEIEINAYPPETRFRVTRRAALDRIAAETGCHLRVGGAYVTPGSRGASTGEALHVWIGGNDAGSVADARAAIMEMLLFAANDGGQGDQIDGDRSGWQSLIGGSAAQAGAIDLFVAVPPQDSLSYGWQVEGETGDVRAASKSALDVMGGGLLAS